MTDSPLSGPVESREQPSARTRLTVDTIADGRRYRVWDGMHMAPFAEGTVIAYSDSPMACILGDDGSKRWVSTGLPVDDLGPVQGRCPRHFLTYCDPCGWVSPSDVQPVLDEQETAGQDRRTDDPSGGHFRPQQWWRDTYATCLAERDRARDLAAHLEAELAKTEELSLGVDVASSTRADDAH